MIRKIFDAILISIAILLGCKHINSNVGNDVGNNPFLNLDFERSSNGYPTFWYAGGKGYKAIVDTNVFYSGNKSLKIIKISEGNFGVGTSTFPFNEAKGKHITFTGYIKSQDVKYGYAGLWWRVDGKNQRVLGFDNMSNRGVKGTTNWKKYKIELDVDKNATNINFGVILSGDGTAWFDDLNIKVNGELYKQEAPKIFIPNIAELNWIKENANTFDTSLSDNESSNLKGLTKIIDSARIIALGEGTHGTNQFFNTKDQIVRFAAEKYKNIVFAMEANMPEAKLVNDYIINGKGVSKAALAGMYFWTWNTQEVLNMIEWMRKYNESGKGKIEFWGFDLQTPTVAMQNVESFIHNYDAEFSDSVSFYYRDISNISSTISNADYHDKISYATTWYQSSINVLNHLIRDRKKYLQLDDSINVDWIIQNARIVEQGAEIHIPGKKSRDEEMALNAEWIISHSPKNVKIVLWAHNFHISKAENSMGSYLNKEYGDKMINFGFAFYSGKYTAVGDTGLGTYSTSLPEPSSVEWTLHKTGIERMILDIRNVSGNTNSSWLNQTLDFRSIGAMAMDYAFYPTVITKNFDVLIYFDKTTPSHLLVNPSIYSKYKKIGLNAYNRNKE